MGSFLRYEDLYRDGEVCLTDKGLEDLISLCNIVYNSHFNYIKSSHDREDLIQEGLCKAIELIRTSKFDSSRSSIKNYLYTGIRNQMKNYIYHTTKDLVVEEESLAEKLQFIDDVDSFYISENLIDSVLNNFTGKDLKKKVVETLKSLCFNVLLESRSEYHAECEGLVALIVWGAIYGGDG